MNIKKNLRKLAELSIGLTAVATLALAGCGGGSGGGSAGGTSPNTSNNTTVTLAGLVSTFAGAAGSWSITDGASSVARFVNPNNITTDGTNLYITDMSGNNIRKIVIATGQVSTLAGSLTGASGVADGTGTAALFNQPGGITTDGTNLYVADSGNNNIRKIVIANGVVTTIAGSITGASGVANGTGTVARFNYPVGITRIGTNLYVADQLNSRILKIDLANSTLVSTFAGSTGTAGWADGVGTSAWFDFPAGITTDGTNLFVADTIDNNIRKITVATQAVTTIAGWHLSTGSGVADGTGSAARFNNPFGIATDGSNLYIADTGNHTIRKIALSTSAVTTLAGMAGASGVANGTGSTARFWFPNDLVYASGVLYVTDFTNGTIRKIQ